VSRHSSSKRSQLELPRFRVLLLNINATKSSTIVQIYPISRRSITLKMLASVLLLSAVGTASSLGKQSLRIRDNENIDLELTHELPQLQLPARSTELPLSVVAHQVLAQLKP
jgi:hypothetical protein